MSDIPCPSGHIGERYVSSRQCVLCDCERAQIRRNSIPRKTTRGMPCDPKIIAKNTGQKTYSGTPCRTCGNTKRYTNGGGCCACLASGYAKYYEQNRDTECVRRAEYRLSHLEQERLKDSEWQRKNPEKNAAKARNRRSRESGVEGKHTADEVKSLLVRQKGKCAYCHRPIRKKYHADHIVAIVNGGTNWISNIQLLCQPCNNQKHAKDPIVYARQIGLLL